MCLESKTSGSAGRALTDEKLLWYVGVNRLQWVGLGVTG